jgi:hypothetical protein
MKHRCASTALALTLLSSAVAAQNPRPDTGVEDVVIVRSLRLSRIAPTDFCAVSRTNFRQAATVEDRYDLKAVATDAASGKVTNADGSRAGTFHACYGPTSDPLVFSYYAEGDVGGVALVGRGECRVTRRDFPEAGLVLLNCRLDLLVLTGDYVGGQLTTNTLASRSSLGPTSDPPGYAQASIVTIRLWKRR